MNEQLTTLQAPENATLYLWFEPWAEGLGFPPGCVIELRAVSAIEGALEFAAGEGRTVVYGWAGSTLEVSVGGRVVHVFDAPVPEAMGKLTDAAVLRCTFRCGGFYSRPFRSLRFSWSRGENPRRPPRHACWDICW